MKTVKHFQSAAELKELILGKEVTVFPMGTDRYNRELSCLRIQTAIGQIDVAECMISKGAAFDWGGKYFKAQEYAKEYSLGVWSDTKFQERPWFYRRRTQ
ncbi:MAG: thermonuclease family protein [Phascolarctobacterium sp.]